MKNVCRTVNVHMLVFSASEISQQVHKQHHTGDYVKSCSRWTLLTMTCMQISHRQYQLTTPARHSQYTKCPGAGCWTALTVRPLSNCNIWWPTRVEGTHFRNVPRRRRLHSRQTSTWLSVKLPLLLPTTRYVSPLTISWTKYSTR